MFVWDFVNTAVFFSFWFSIFFFLSVLMFSVLLLAAVISLFSQFLVQYLYWCIGTIFNSGESTFFIFFWHILSIYIIARIWGIVHFHQFSYTLVDSFEFLLCLFKEWFWVYYTGTAVFQFGSFLSVALCDYRSISVSGPNSLLFLIIFSRFFYIRLFCYVLSIPILYSQIVFLLFHLVVCLSSFFSFFIFEFHLLLLLGVSSWCNG